MIRSRPNPCSKEKDMQATEEIDRPRSQIHVGSQKRCGETQGNMDERRERKDIDLLLNRE